MTAKKTRSKTGIEYEIGDDKVKATLPGGQIIELDANLTFKELREVAKVAQTMNSDAEMQIGELLGLFDSGAIPDRVMEVVDGLKAQYALSIMKTWIDVTARAVTEGLGEVQA